MSRHARRGLRTTAAAAGLAALGVGFAAPALAAPELPATPAAPGDEQPTLPAAPDGAAPEEALAQLAELAGSDLGSPPELFTFEMPSITMPMATGPAGATPTAPAAPGSDSLAPIVNVEPGGDMGGVPEMPEFSQPDIEFGTPGAPGSSDLGSATEQLNSGLADGMSALSGAM